MAHYLAVGRGLVSKRKLVVVMVALLSLVLAVAPVLAECGTGICTCPGCG